MKKRIISTIFLFYFSVSFSQNLDSLRYSFLNEKIVNDSLTGFPLSNYIMPIDTTCYVQTYLTTNKQDTSIQYYCHNLEPLLDKYGLGNHIDSTDIFKSFNKDYKDGKSYSISIILNPSFRQQVVYPKKEKWDKLKLYKQVKYTQQKKRKKTKPQGQYSMSYPIFFGDMDRAIIFVSVYYGPLYAQSYVEYYEKTKNGDWNKIKGHMIWMS